MSERKDIIRRYFENNIDKIFAERYSGEPCYAIYQLTPNNKNNAFLFRSLDDDIGSNDNIEYKLAYANNTASLCMLNPLNTDNMLNKIFFIFNEDDRLNANKMRSISISDIIIIFPSDKNIAKIFYVDTIDFTEITTINNETEN